MWGRYRRWPRLRLFIITASILALAIYLRAAKHDAPQPGLVGFTDPTVLRSGPCEVIAVIDGDTLFVSQGGKDSSGQFRGKVRLLGINTPETVQRDIEPQPFGQEATEFLKAKVAGGNVRLELDKRRLDRYGRSLAYLYVGNACLNEELVAAGLARVHTYPGDSTTMNRQLLRAQDEARRRELGIWGKEPRTK
ncbi:thermonuclease family protein [Anatilimnocola floriformis]|uniref:thermonuclease family protein n=1 Tax=Anatilimnocola floriformis TaxID=2948575 RepID=UPI0020C4FEA2|nr:thermonuclease family protein [Anatilimnocola floriformis]